MKKIIFFTIALSLFAFTTQGAELKFGYIDLNRALNESDKGKEAIRTLESIVKAKYAVIDEKRNEIKRLEEEIAKQGSILTPESMKEKQKQHEKLLKDYQRMVQDTQEEIQKKQQEFMQEILTELRKQIKKFGEKEGYTAIFEIVESGILYMPEELDLTEGIIKSFNEIKINR